MSENTANNSAKRERPGCVTVYAVLLWIGSALVVIGAFCVGVVGLGDVGGSLGVVEICLGLLSMLLASIAVAAGIGIWQMRRWGLVLVLILQSVSVIVSVLRALLFAASGFAGNLGAEIGNILGLALSGYIIYWFITNRALFNGVPAYQTVIGPDGEPVQEPAKKKGNDTATILAVVGGAAMVLILICVVVIALLAIMGPQIGNVFSQITYTLENSPAG